MLKTVQPQIDSLKPLTSVHELTQYIKLTAEQITAMEEVAKSYPFQISRYTATLLDPEDENCPIRRQFLPDKRELADEEGTADPLKEEENRIASNVIKVYPDRVAVIVSGRCASLCRFCFRKSMFKSSTSRLITQAEREKALTAIALDPTIRDVLVTGGDPFMLPDQILDDFLKGLRAIKHVEIIRLGTRLLSTMPQRITPQFAAMLAKYHPLWVNVHFNHPQEVTAEAEKAAANLMGAGIPLNNQSVLLKGINDKIETMMTLSRRLLKMRIRPYYLFQCHLIEGTAHFRTAIEDGQQIIAGLRGRISGLGVPQYALDTPYGKIPINPNYLFRREGKMIKLRTFDNQLWQEPNPLPRSRETDIVVINENVTLVL